MSNTLELGDVVPTVVIRVRGRLLVRGESVDRITASDRASIDMDGDIVMIVCDRDCEVVVPRHVSLRDIEVRGPTDIVNIVGDVHISEVERGHARLAQIGGSVKVDNVERDLIVEDIGGSVDVDDVGGNMRVMRVAGHVRVDDVGGNLQSDGPFGALEASDISGNLEIRDGGGAVRVGDVSGNLTLSGALRELRIGDIGGNAYLEKLDCDVALGDVGGNVDLRNVAAVKLSDVGGNLQLSGDAGSLHADIGGNLHAFGARLSGKVELDVGGNADVALAPKPGERYVLEAGGNVHVRLSDDAQADITAEDHRGRETLRVGAGGAEVSIEAGGRIDFSGAADVEVRREAREHGRKMGSFKIKLPKTPPMPPMPPLPNFSNMINAEVSKAMSEVNRELSKAGIEVQRAMREANEEMSREFGKRGERGWRGERDNSGPARSWADAQRNAADAARGNEDAGVDIAAPADDIIEEQKAILKMLADKKITVAQAEQLLAALEGKTA